MSAGESPGQERPGAPIGASPRLHMRALSILRRRIRDGSLPPGAKLTENAIASEFGVSRAPVRQALLALVSEGLARRSPKRGFTVAEAAAVTGLPAADETAEAALIAQPSWQPIYDAVEKAIAERISVGSWRIVEVDLARHYGVSRTVAREVTARLHQRGLVKRDAKARWYAPGLTADYISELYEMRWTLEPLALVKASRKAPPELVTRMRNHLDSAIARADVLTGGELDALEAELHIEFLGHCGNGTLIEALRRYQSLLVAHSFLYAASSEQFPSEPFLPEHEAIIAHLATGRIASAGQAMADHLKAARERAISRVETISRNLRVAELPYMQPLPASSGLAASGR